MIPDIPLHFDYWSNISVYNVRKFKTILYNCLEIQFSKVGTGNFLDDLFFISKINYIQSQNTFWLFCTMKLCMFQERQKSSNS